MKSMWGRQQEPQKNGMAKYLGLQAGLARWEIDGQVYTDSVASIGGGAPAVGKSYPAICGQPDTRSQWVAIVPGNQVRLHPRFTPTTGPGEWATYRQNASRSGRVFGSAYTEFTSAGYLMSDTNGSMLITRIFDNKVYVVRSVSFSNGFHRTTLVEFDGVSSNRAASKTYRSTGSNATASGIMEVLVTQDFIYLVEWQAGARYVGAGRNGHAWNLNGPVNFSRITKLNRQTFGVVWSSPYQNTVSLRPAPSLWVTNGKVVALAETDANPSLHRLMLGQYSVSDDTGVPVHVPEAPILGFTRFNYEDPQFKLYSCEGMRDLSWEGSPASYAEAMFATQYHPNIFPEETFDAASRGFYGSPISWSAGSPNGSRGWSGDHALQGTVYMQNTPDAAMPNIARVHNWFCLPDAGLSIPAPRRGMQVAAFKADGSRAWIRRGWGSTTSEGEIGGEEPPEPVFPGGGERRVYSPLICGPGFKMLVLVEEYEFLETQMAQFTLTFSEYLDEEREQRMATPNFNVLPMRTWRTVREKTLWLEVWDYRTGETIKRKLISEETSGELMLPNGAPSHFFCELFTIDHGETMGEDMETIAIRGTAPPVDLNAPPSTNRYNGYNVLAKSSSWGSSTNTAATPAPPSFGLRNPPDPYKYTGTYPYAGRNPLNKFGRQSQEASYIVYAQSGPHTFKSYKPLPFDPYNCCLSLDGSRIVFAPQLHPATNTTTGELSSTTFPIPGTGAPNQLKVDAYGEKIRPKVDVRASCWDWHLDTVWEHVIPTNNPNKFNIGNPFAIGDGRIMLHYRRNDVAYFRQVMIGNGALAYEESVNLLNTPTATGAPYGEMEQAKGVGTAASVSLGSTWTGYGGAPPGGVPTMARPYESIYAGNTFVLVRENRALLYLRADPPP